MLVHLCLLLVAVGFAPIISGHFQSGDSQSALAQGSTFRIGIVLPLSGSRFQEGNVFRQGLAKAQSELPGFSSYAKIFIEDSRSNPQAAVSAIRRLIDGHRVDVVLAMSEDIPYNVQSLLTGRSVPVIAAQRLFGNSLAGSLVFNLGYTPSAIRELVINWGAVRKCGSTKIFPINEGEISQLIRALGRRSTPQNSFDVVEKFRPTDFDFRRALAKYAQFPTSCVLFALRSEQLNQLLSQARDVKLAKRVLVIQADQTGTLDALAPNKTSEIKALDISLDAKLAQQISTFTRAEQLMYAQGYEALHLLSTMKSLPPGAIAQRLRSVSGRKSVLGTYSFKESDGHQFLQLPLRLAAPHLN